MLLAVAKDKELEEPNFAGRTTLFENNKLRLSL